MPHSAPLVVGSLVFPKIEQLDFTGPFSVLARLPNSVFHVLWKERAPVVDNRGLILTPTLTLAEAPPLDVLVIPGGPGQEALMADEEVLSFIRTQAAQARYILTVCTGSLIYGATGLLRGVRATTHWSALDLLKYFGAIPVDERVVVDGKVVSAAGVTSGIDGALRVATLLRGEATTQSIELGMEYSPQPPFRSGTPAEAPPEIVALARAVLSEISAKRLVTAREIARRLGIDAA